MTDHPITPPPELVEQWRQEHAITYNLARQAAQWGADMELEACCEYMQHEDFHGFARELRTARRPKPLSLKELALAALHAVATGANDTREQHQDLDTIRQALEALPD